MSTPYIPARDADFAAWSANFAAVITANPANYGLATADATAISSTNALFQTAYTAAINPSTRTSTTVAAKDVQKAATLIVERGYAQIIQNNAGVSDANKATAGLTIRSTGRTPIPAPGTAPILGLIGHTPGVTTLKSSDTSSPASKKKPFGAIQLELYAQVNPTGSPDVALSVYQGAYTKTPFAVETPAGGLGKTVAYWGRWITRRGLVGPWSAVLSTTGT